MFTIDRIFVNYVDFQRIFTWCCRFAFAWRNEFAVVNKTALFLGRYEKHAANCGTRRHVNGAIRLSFKGIWGQAAT